MIDMELELEEERICEEDEENRFELNVEDKVLYVENGEMSELLGIVQEELWSLVELDVVGNRLLVLLLEWDLDVAKPVEAVNAEVWNTEGLCGIDDDTIDLLFNEDSDWRGLLEEGFNEVAVFEVNWILGWVRLELENWGDKDSDEECPLEDCRLDLELDWLENEVLADCLMNLLVDLETEGTVLRDLLVEEVASGILLEV